MPFVAIACALVSIALFLASRAQGAKALDIRSTGTTDSAELAALAAAVAGEIGAGSFSRVAELKGTAECAAPLQAEMSGTACVYYRAVATREYEERREVTDDKGSRRTETHRGSETVSRNERSVPFLLRDAAGTLEVDPEGASIDAVKTLSRFEPANGGRISLGSFALDLGAAAFGGGGRRTIGWKFEEWCLPVGARLYVLGEAVDEGGRLRVGKPGAKGGRFIVSVKSEEELLKAARGLSTGLAVAAALLLAGAAVLAVLLLLGVIR